MRRLNFAIADAWRHMARGVLVDKTALMAVLDGRKLSAAGLDCFVTKPFGNPALAG